MIFIVIAILFSSLYAQGMEFSGIFESSVTGDGNAPSFAYGVEEYANIRMQTRIGSNALFFGAVNLIATAPAHSDDEKSYAALIELERLYFRLKGETIDFDGGLMRLPFGYGQIWNPSDFLNPKNPLFPYARPIAVLGGGLSWYPTDSFKFMEFAATSRNASSQTGGIVGFLAEQHWNRASIQTLYSYEFPDEYQETDYHRAGISLKADLELGFVIDMLYTFSKDMKSKEGMQFSAGFDYSLFSGNLIILTEYLYNGAASPLTFYNENNIYSGFTWRFSDYTNAGIAMITVIDDKRYIPILSFNHDIFQGVSFAFIAQRLVNSTYGGDLDYSFNLDARLRFRF